MSRAPTRIVMIGTSPRTRGGISSVVETWRRAGFFDRWPVDYVETHRDGTRWEKLATAIAALGRFAALVLRHRRAVLHVHAASRASFWRKSAFMAIAMLVRWPVVFHLHGGGFAEFHERECGPIARRIVRFFLDRAAAIVVVSERWRAWMRGATRNPNVVTIPNAVPLPPLGQAPRERDMIAFIGRCSEGKGVYDLLQAAASLRRDLPGLRVECAGDGDLDELDAAVANMGLADRVRINGWIGARRRNELLARASAFVLPSHAEGLPMGLLEAMAAGCPVVASTVGGIPDVVVDGVNGLLVPPGDTQALAEALARVLGDETFARRLARAARATIAARFTPEASLARLEQVYEGLGLARPARAMRRRPRLRQRFATQRQPAQSLRP